MEFKLEKNYFDSLSKYISDEKFAKEIQSNIDFVEKYIDKIDTNISDEKEKQITYRQLGSIVFSCVEALWKSLVLIVNTNCEKRACKEKCQYHKFDDVNTLSKTPLKAVLSHLVNMRLLHLLPFEEEAIETLQDLRNHIHLTKTLIDGDKSIKFNKQFVEEMLRIYYVTINQAEMHHWYYKEEQPCLRELDGDGYVLTKEQQEYDRKEYYTNKIILACIDLFYKKPITEKNEQILFHLSKPKDLDIEGLADEMGKWLYYAGAHFRTEEKYQEALKYFRDNLQHYLSPKNDLLFQIDERRNYYYKILNSDLT